MSENNDLQQKLVSRIKARRQTVNQFVAGLERHGTRLINVGIISTAATTLLVAGPAVGGGKFTEGIQSVLGLASDTWVWRALCFAAAILSGAGAVANNMYRSHEVAGKLARAKASSMLLEGLETAVEFGQMSMDEAARRFQETLAQMPFIEEGVEGASPAESSESSA